MKKIFAIIALVLPFVISSCVKDEIYVGPPSIDKIDLSPKMGSITPDNDVTVTATITDKNSDIVAVSLKYSVSGGAETSLDMKASDGGYIAVIPKQAENAVVEYCVTAENALGKSATSAKAKYTVSWIQIEYGTLSDIILSEINGADKFIELYNPSEKAVDLGGMVIAKNGTKLKWDGVEIAAGTVLNPGQFAVMGCKGADHSDKVSEDVLYLGTSTTGLSGSKSVLATIQDAEGNCYDYFVNVATDGHSPDDACWDGALEIDFSAAGKSASRFLVDGKWEWYVGNSTLGTKNEKDADAPKFENTVDFGALPAAAIISISHAPAAPTKDDEVTVTAVLANVSEATLAYSVNGGEQTSVAMSSADDTYTASIPAQAADSEISYVVKVKGLDGNEVASEEKTYTVLGEVIEYDYTKLVLNELNGNAKYIEIYNAGDIEIDLAGCVLRKDEDTSTDFEIPSLKVAPKGYAIIGCSGYAGAEGTPTTSGGLSAKKALTMELLDPEKNLLDKFATTNTAENKNASYSRVPDGDGKWYYAEPTEGAANGISAGVIGSDMKFVINELSGSDKKMELFNGTDADIALAGYTIEKDEEVKWTGTDEVVPAGGYLVLTFDKKGSGSGIITSGFSGGKSVSVVLKDAEGNEVDAFLRGRKTAAAEGEEPAWGNLSLEEQADYSFSRIDSGSWRYATATIGAANGEAAAVIANK